MASGLEEQRYNMQIGDFEDFAFESDEKIKKRGPEKKRVKRKYHGHHNGQKPPKYGDRSQNVIVLASQATEVVVD